MHTFTANCTSGLKELLDLLYPDVENYQDPVVEKIGEWNFEPIVKAAADNDEKEVISLKLLDAPNPNNGSNNWAISPEKSATGGRADYLTRSQVSVA